MLLVDTQCYHSLLLHDMCNMVRPGPKHLYILESYIHLLEHKICVWPKFEIQIVILEFRRGQGKEVLQTKKYNFLLQPKFRPDCQQKRLINFLTLKAYHFSFQNYLIHMSSVIFRILPDFYIGLIGSFSMISVDYITLGNKIRPTFCPGLKIWYFEDFFCAESDRHIHFAL